MNLPERQEPSEQATKSGTPLGQDFLRAHAQYQQEVASRALRILGNNGGQATDDFCHLVEHYRVHTGHFPVPIEQLPCNGCSKRTEGV